MREMELSECVDHEPCPECGSRDNLARYDDGHGFCFGCEYYEHGDGEARQKATPRRKGNMLGPLEYRDIPARGLRETTCRKFGYGIAGGKQVANYVDERGRVVAQHTRTKDKKFSWKGEMKEALPLWGQQLWRDGGKMVVITEGEIDCMTVSQLQRNKWPVVSIRSGAAGAKRDIRNAVAWLETYEQVIFMFDMDDPGQDAARECALLLSPGKAKVARLPLKDANECHTKGQSSAVIDAVWGAKPYRPDGIVYIEDLFEEACKEVEEGLPWCLEGMTTATHGRRFGELYAFGAGTGVGKTDLLTQQAAYDATVLGQKVGMIYLEMPPVELTRRVAGKVAEAVFHVPGIKVDPGVRAAAFEQLRGKVAIYDHFGETEWDVIKSRIRHMAVADEIKIIYLDHLTAMADPSCERESLETCMKEMAGLAQELGIIIIFVSHLATPDGKPHEEGGRVMIRHFKGSRSIGFWSYFMFGLERDQQAADEDERHTTTLRCLKDRLTGQHTGTTMFLRYDAGAGMLIEMDKDPFAEGGGDDDNPF